MFKFVIAGLLATAAIAPAAAAPITYTLSGTFSGTIGGQAFTSAAVFTGIGDTSNVFDGGYYKSVALTSLTALSGGTTFTITDATRFFSNPNSVSGFSLASGPDFLDFAAPALASYGATTTFSATSVNLDYSAPFNTNAGEVVLSGATDLVFSATGGAVPEPATWAMMVAGFGLVGAARRRQKVAVTFG